MQRTGIIFVFAAALLQTFVDANAAKAVCPSLLTWDCDNGECIHFAQRCDGKKDCTDGSDETVRECISFQCLPNSFRCAYGACVNKTAECNGAKDCADNSDELTTECVPDLAERQRGNCTVDQFHCSSGECIPSDRLCDGSVDCKDKSDETVQECASNCCPPFGFKCGYGGCVDERAKCDGSEDCADGSDENELLCGTQRKPDKTASVDVGVHGTTSSPTIRPNGVAQPDIVRGANETVVYCFSYPDLSQKCEIKKVPHSGWIEFVATSRSQITVGNLVNSFTPVTYQCLPEYKLNGKRSNICFNGEWMHEVPECVAV